MAYIKTIWLNKTDVDFEAGVSPAHSSANWNKQEQGIFDAHEAIDSLVLTDRNFTIDLETKIGTIEFNATGDQTALEIKSLYESNADTNAYDDVEKLKVSTSVQDIIDIKTLMSSDDTTLDELQEVVNFIKTNKSDLDTLTLENIAETATLKYFTLIEKDNLANQSGINTGDQDLSSLATKDEISSLNSFKNKIINGGFMVWTDTDTTSTVAEEGHGADLFKNKFWYFNTGESIFTSSFLNDRKFLVETITVATTGSASNRLTSGIEYYGEAPDFYNMMGGDVVMSFGFKSNVLGKFAVSLKLYGGGAEKSVIVKTFDYSTFGTEQIIEIVFNVPANSSLLYPLSIYDGNIGFSISIGASGGIDYITTENTWTFDNQHLAITSDSVDWTGSIGNYIAISELQLEKGSSRTPFELINYETTLSNIERYYEQGIFYRSGAYLTTTAGVATHSYRTKKRAIPSIAKTVDWLTNYTGVTVSSVTAHGFGHYPTGGVSGDQGRYELTWSADARF